MNIFDTNGLSSYWGTTNPAGGGGSFAMMLMPFDVAFAAYLRDIANFR